MKKLAFVLLAITTLSLTNCKNKTEEVSKNSTEKTEKKPLENPETASLSIEGMTCEIGCAKAIESKLANLDGVASAKVDFDTKLATVTFDGSIQTRNSLKETVEKIAGGAYKVSTIR